MPVIAELVLKALILSLFMEAYEQVTKEPFSPTTSLVMMTEMGSDSTQ